jgi:ribulose-5-phosphate 4-epimerase/fuculose-1-phosphate aldolase
MRTEAEAREEMIQTLRYMWERGHANTTGVSISERLEDRPGHILVDQSGTGFRKCDVTINDLLIIDEDCVLVEDAPNGARRKAPVNVVIHTEYYKANPLARTCVHCHAPFTQVFACKNRTIPPFTLQAKLIGEVPCVFLDDMKLKKEYADSGETIAVPSGLHTRDEVFYVMKKVAEEAVRLLSPRNAEMKKHGLGVNHFEHGIFVFGRNMGEAFDNLERAEANARALLLSSLLP